MSEISPAVVIIDYTNHRGERRERRILPQPAGVRFDRTPWHPEPQWLLLAWDFEKGAMRDFAMTGIHGWRAG
jgi:predicted DNA-binding transcriptional regulator YafY